MMKRLQKFAVALVAATVLVTLGSDSARAQSASVNGTATITIPTVLALSVTNTSVSFGSPTASDFNAGFIDASSGSSSITTRGNVVHDVEITADASNFSGGSGSKPASDLHWSMDGFSSQDVALSTTASDVATALSRGVNNAGSVDYRILLDYSTDEPATYSLGFTYTVVPN